MEDVIRLAETEDVDQVHALTLQAYAPIRELNIKFSAATADRDLVVENITRNASYVLERDGEIAATVTVQYPWTHPEHIVPYPFIWWFAVHPKFKRKGVGSKLLSYVEEKILGEQAKAPAVYLATAKRHPWLVEIYERRGYQAFQEKVHEGDDIVFLRKVLNPSLYNLLDHHVGIGEQR
ncbi:GNAT family N-acetyltransferase [Priestia filamentosa]|uniref:GNAT family N-acetyltransferase n=1 Tax=Priestia filamentosa TaxID=1402861 RepID=UPI0005895BB3|nr:GNAT family N-acetyltransferase [Priestia filamentosa]RJS66434.1 N-acetyltransferase [Priestia filamentosa]WCM15356.1 GNAT family N-acetyltransferase [Priestia filamentosa]